MTIKRRNVREILSDLNAVRQELGMDVRSYPGTSRDGLLVIESRFINLKRARINGHEDLSRMSVTEISRRFQIHEIDAKAFLDKFYSSK